VSTATVCCTLPMPIQRRRHLSDYLCMPTSALPPPPCPPLQARMGAGRCWEVSAAPAVPQTAPAAVASLRPAQQSAPPALLPLLPPATASATSTQPPPLPQQQHSRATRHPVATAMVLLLLLLVWGSTVAPLCSTVSLLPGRRLLMAALLPLLPPAATIPARRSRGTVSSWAATAGVTLAAVAAVVTPAAVATGGMITIGMDG
jgi:uncharacterized membrane protein